MAKVTFKRDRNGYLIGYKDGKRVGMVGGMGDLPPSMMPKGEARKMAAAKKAATKKTTAKKSTSKKSTAKKRKK